MENPNTVIHLTADHGLHLGPYAISPPGEVENKLPVLFSIYPKPFLESHPEADRALKHNQQSLLSPFDLFKTIQHLRTYPDEEEKSYRVGSHYSKVAKSMFTEVPYTRTCEEAGIPERACICE